MAKLNGEWNTPYPANGFDGVSFIFVWKNPSDQPAVINAESYLALTDFATCMQNRGLTLTRGEQCHPAWHSR